MPVAGDKPEAHRHISAGDVTGIAGEGGFPFVQIAY